MRLGTPILLAGVPHKVPDPVWRFELCGAHADQREHTLTRRITRARRKENLVVRGNSGRTTRLDSTTVRNARLLFRSASLVPVSCRTLLAQRSVLLPPSRLLARSGPPSGHERVGRTGQGDTARVSSG